MSPFIHDSTGISDEKTFALLPDKTWFDFEIISAEEAVSKNGNPIINLKCAVAGHPSYAGKWVWHTVVFLPAGQKGANMSVHFRKCIGEPYGGKDEVDAERWKGKSFKGFVVIDEYMGKKKNKIAQVSPLSSDAGEQVPF